MHEPLIEIRGGHLSVSGRVLIDELDWSIEAGQIWSVVGVNGCGKSTLLRWLGHLPLPGSVQAAGQCLWQASPPVQWSRKNRAQFLAWMGQSDAVGFDCTVSERLLAGLYPTGRFMGWESAADRQRITDLLLHYDLAGLHHRLLSSLSGGERRRVAMAAAHIQNATVTLLDEPLSQLDWAHQVQLGKRFRVWPSLGQRALVWVTHEPNMALRFSTHLLAIGPAGQTWQGPICDMAQSTVFERVYGCAVESANSPFVLFPKTD